jgi:GTP-binding protein
LSLTHENVRAWQRVFQIYDSLPDDTTPLTAETPLYELPHDEFTFAITRDQHGAFHVRGRRIERAAAMTYWDNDEAVMRFQNILETLGISEALKAAGVQIGDTVFIGDYELEWTD